MTSSSPGTPRPNVVPRESWIAITKSARYYSLGPDDPAGVSEVWFVLHGYSQLASAFVKYFADLDDGRRLIVAPEALNKYYIDPADGTPARDRAVGATWMTREDRDHEMSDYVSYLDTLHEATMRRVAPNARIIVVGFSQGAATATRWIVRGSARVDHLVLWGGTLPPETDLSVGPHALRGVPLIMMAGLRDQYATAEVLTAEERRFQGAGIPYRLVRFEGGHVVSRAALRQLVGLLNGAPTG